MWSWLPGWADSGRFSDEDDMQNTQTFVKVGASTVGGYSGNDEWDLGDVTIDLKSNGVYVHPFSKNSYGFDVGDPSGNFTIDCFIDVTVNYYGGLRHNILTRCELWKEDISLAWSWFEGIYWWNWEPDISLGGPADRGYTPFGKPAELVLKEWYCGEDRGKKGRSRR